MKITIDIPDEDYKFIKDLQSVVIGRGNCKTVQYNVINGIKRGIPYEERLQGEWKPYMTGYKGTEVTSITYKCSCCGRTIVYVADVDNGIVRFLAKYPFCHCGADMRGEE